MDASLRDAVRRRAANLCEYCGLPQEVVRDAPFHVEHIRAKQHGGTNDLSNLALACDRCNLYKGPSLTAVDPKSGQVVSLFDPRREIWSAHFAQRGALIIGLTQTGRATVRLLNMNAARRVELRAALLPRNPPPS
jgi:hypothetical protein